MSVSLLTWEIPAATFLHLVLFSLMFVVGTCTQSQQPLFREEDVMIVEMAGPALLADRMPQKAERAPDSAPGENLDAPVPDAMALPTPDAKAKGDRTNDADRERLIDEMRKQAALRDLTAPLGTTDRAATSAEGTVNPDGVATSGVSDPELAKWVQKTRDAVLPNWNPIRSYCVANPGLVVQAAVPVAADGTLTDPPRVVKSSGNSSLDGSVLRAIEATAKFPPPPAKFADGLTGTVSMKCKDIL